MSESQYQIIIRFLQSEFTEEETIRFNDWRKTSAENEQQFQEVKYLWEKAHMIPDSLEISVDKKAALAKVHSKITVPKVVPIRRNLFRWAAAASILLLIGGGLWYNFFTDRTDIIQFATAANEQKEVRLPDNSLVWMNENSTLSYAAKFDNTSREVQLQGNAIFEVTPNKSKPFIVQSNDLLVTVLGTKFNVHSSNGMDKPQVHVLHGKVKVALKNNTENNLMLTKGMTAQFDRKLNALALLDNYSANALFWETRTLVFKNQKLEKVIAEIETAYQVNIELASEKMLNCPFTGRFKDQNIDEVLDIIKDLYSFEIRKQDSENFKITRGLCN